MNKFTHPFDHLNQWDRWEDSEIEKIISDETMVILQEAVDLLDDETKNEKTIVTRDAFVILVRDMRKLYRKGSRSLGDAIIKASELADNREYEKAIKIHEDFLSSCKSRFYRDIARGYIREYSEKL
jgi:replicative superfamily II helicase